MIIDLILEYDVNLKWSKLRYSDYKLPLSEHVAVSDPMVSFFHMGWKQQLEIADVPNSSFGHNLLLPGYII